MALLSPRLWSAAICLISSINVAVAAPAANSSALPVVDLGYELQQATVYNSTGGYYNFSNIRYAAPPTGNLRFQAPQPPAQNRGEVQTGSPDRICAQASPAWELIAAQYVVCTVMCSTQADSIQIPSRVFSRANDVQPIIFRHKQWRWRVATS